MPEETTLCDQIAEELKKLIQDEGMTPWRVESLAPTIMKVIGTSDGQEVRQVITSLLSGDDKYTNALRHALGVTDTPSAHHLTERRAQHTSVMHISEATVRRWESRALLSLARKLEAVSDEDHSPVTGDLVVEAINGLRGAVDEQTAVLRGISDLLQRFAVAWRIPEN